MALGQGRVRHLCELRRLLGTSRRDLSEREFDEDDACILVQVRIVEEGRIGVFTTAQEKDEYVTRTEAENQSN